MDLMKKEHKEGECRCPLCDSLACVTAKELDEFIRKNLLDALKFWKKSPGRELWKKQLKKEGGLS